MYRAANPPDAVCISTAIDAETLNGRVTHVRDGDTIEVAGRPIRLQGLNCAELGTRLGSAGRAAVSRLVAGQSIMCELTGERTYDREVGRCFLSSGDDIAAMLIEQGVCGRCAASVVCRGAGEGWAVSGRCSGLLHVVGVRFVSLAIAARMLATLYAKTTRSSEPRIFAGSIGPPRCPKIPEGGGKLIRETRSRAGGRGTKSGFATADG